MAGGVTLDPGLVIATIGVIVAAIQFYLGLRRERFENTFRLIQWLQAPEILRTRNRTAELISKAKDVNYDFYKLSVDERAELSGVANLFGLAGLLAKRNQVDRQTLFTGWSRNIVATYERLEPYFQWRHTLAGGDSLKPYFHWLATVAKKRIGAKSRVARDVVPTSTDQPAR